jgi:hypothetical protein
MSGEESGKGKKKKPRLSEAERLRQANASMDKAVEKFKRGEGRGGEVAAYRKLSGIRKGKRGEKRKAKDDAEKEDSVPPLSPLPPPTEEEGAFHGPIRLTLNAVGHRLTINLESAQRQWSTTTYVLPKGQDWIINGHATTLHHQLVSMSPSPPPLVPPAPSQEPRE